MRRSDFGVWGATLGRDDFARALAALGLSGYARTEIREALNLPAPLWSLPYLPPPTELDAAKLAYEWTQATAEVAKPLRLALSTWPQSHSPTWVVRQLTRNAVGVDGLFIDLRTLERRSQWHWPLKLALLDGGQSELRTRIVGGRSWLVEQFVQLVEPESPDPCDLLLVFGGLRATLAQIVAGRLSAAVVAVLEPLAEPWPRARALLDAVVADAAANAVAFIPIGSNASDWLDSLLWNLSHDGGLDVALLQAARQLHLRPPLVFSSHDFLDETRISRQRERLWTRVRDATHAVRALPDFVLPQTARAPEDLEYDVEQLRNLPFAHEHHGAAETAALAREVEHLPNMPRFIQAQVYEAEEGQPVNTESARPARALRTATAHELEMRVGPTDTDWLAAPGAFPEEKLPPAEEHRLDVVLTAPALFDAAQSSSITLPERGPSTTCRFWLNAPAEEMPFDARIIVLHEGRIVQTALLHGQVTANPETVADADALGFGPEAVIGTFAGLAGRPRFDGALVINHDATDVRRLTLIAGDEVDIREPRDFDDAVNAIGAKLEDAVTADVEGGTLREDGTREMLVYLARHGRTLFEALQDLDGGDTLAAGERLQILAADAEAFFPLEFVYDCVSPNDDAELCPNAEHALSTGVCDGCPATSDPRYVCPLGFWCLSKIIERHVHDKKAAAELPDDFRVDIGFTDNRKRLRALSAALFAASSRVDEYKAGTIAAVAEQLADALGKPASQVKTWPDWATRIGSESPPLLVLLPHTEKDAAQLSTLVIEAAERLAVDRINASYVGAGPIVLLLGCRTGDPTIPFQRFPAKFRRCGAAIVLASLTKVLGRYASQIAAQTVKLLAERGRERQVTFGEVIRDVRRALLAAGVPTVLALTAYGDADWVLGPDV
jgi:hypothetical protein